MSADVITWGSLRSLQMPFCGTESVLNLEWDLLSSIKYKAVDSNWLNFADVEPNCDADETANECTTSTVELQTDQTTSHQHSSQVTKISLMSQSSTQSFSQLVKIRPGIRYKLLLCCSAATRSTHGRWTTPPPQPPSKIPLKFKIKAILHPLHPHWRKRQKEKHLKVFFKALCFY